MDVAFNTKPLSEALQDKSIPDSLKKRILYIQEVRKYAIDSLGLQDNPKVYQTLYNQNGQPLVHLLTVAEPYKMEAKEFNFPVVSWFIGSFTYKGFFDSTAAKKVKKLTKKNNSYESIEQSVNQEMNSKTNVVAKSSRYTRGDNEMLDKMKWEQGIVEIKSPNSDTITIVNFRLVPSGLR